MQARDDVSCHESARLHRRDSDVPSADGHGDDMYLRSVGLISDLLLQSLQTLVREAVFLNSLHLPTVLIHPNDYHPSTVVQLLGQLVGKFVVLPAVEPLGRLQFHRRRAALAEGNARPLRDGVFVAPQVLVRQLTEEVADRCVGLTPE